MWKKVLIGIVAVIVVIVLVGFLMPSSTHVERTIVINEPASKIFPELSNYEHHMSWSPWQKLDTSLTHTYEGQEGEVGHSDTWQSHGGNLGEGSQTITKIIPNERIESALVFGGRGGTNAYFQLDGEGEGTKVTWAVDMQAGMNPVARYMNMFMKGSMEKIFDDGLNDLKTHVESLPDPEPEMEAMPMEEGATSDSTAVETSES